MSQRRQQVILAKFPYTSPYFSAYAYCMPCLLCEASNNSGYIVLPFCVCMQYMFVRHAFLLMHAFVRTPVENTPDTHSHTLHVATEPGQSLVSQHSHILDPMHGIY